MSIMKTTLAILLLITVLTTTFVASTRSKNRTKNESRLILGRIEIDEEMDAGMFVVNLTDLIRNNESNRSLAESIKFETSPKRSGQFQLSDYFQIETKRVRNHQNGTSTTNIVLRTSGKRLDREYLCRLSSLRSECSCESDCLVWLDLIVDDDQPTRLPILLRDINDNKPFFYSANLKIELDLSSSTESSLRIPLKEAIDLDSMARHRVREYHIEEEQLSDRIGTRNGKVAVVYEEKNGADDDKPKLNLDIEWSPVDSADVDNQAIK